jgi:hypothetical protein
MPSAILAVAGKILSCMQALLHFLGDTGSCDLNGTVTAELRNARGLHVYAFPERISLGKSRLSLQLRRAQSKGEVSGILGELLGELQRVRTVYQCTHWGTFPTRMKM